MEKAVQVLREYLDDIGFDGIFKYILSVNFYHLNPFHINNATKKQFLFLFNQIQNIELVKCLCTMEKIKWDSLTTIEKKVAEALIQGELMLQDENSYLYPVYQLIALPGLYLFIDGKINFPTKEFHKVYIGIDSTLMLYYIDTLHIKPESYCLDLCTGTGLGGLYLSRYADRVVLVDIDENALKLSHINWILNGKKQGVEIRNENIKDTAQKRENADVLLCNPPFVAFPPGIKAPLFALGEEKDGLGQLRFLFQNVDNFLNENGKAVFVVDLIGDEKLPFFCRELEEYAQKLNAGIDLFVDNKLDVESQIQAITLCVRRLYPDMDAKKAEQMVRDFIFNDLHVKFYYLSTIVVHRKSIQKSVRIFNRYTKIDNGNGAKYNLSSFYSGWIERK